MKEHKSNIFYFFDFGEGISTVNDAEEKLKELETQRLGILRRLKAKVTLKLVQEKLVDEQFNSLAFRRDQDYLRIFETDSPDEKNKLINAMQETESEMEMEGLIDG